MVCEDDADTDIRIPAVMLPIYAGELLGGLLYNNSKGQITYFAGFYEFMGSSSLHVFSSFQHGFSSLITIHNGIPFFSYCAAVLPQASSG